MKFAVLAGSKNYKEVNQTLAERAKKYFDKVRIAPIRELKPTETSYSDVDLVPDAKYSYKIVVQDNDGLVGDPVQSDVVQSPLTKPDK